MSVHEPLHKIFQNAGFLGPIFSLVRTAEITGQRKIAFQHNLRSSPHTMFPLEAKQTATHGMQNWLVRHTKMNIIFEGKLHPFFRALHKFSCTVNTHLIQLSELNKKIRKLLVCCIYTCISIQFGYSFQKKRLLFLQYF